MAIPLGIDITRSDQREERSVDEAIRLGLETLPRVLLHSMLPYRDPFYNLDASFDVARVLHLIRFKNRDLLNNMLRQLQADRDLGPWLRADRTWYRVVSNLAVNVPKNTISAALTKRDGDSIPMFEFVCAAPSRVS